MKRYLVRIFDLRENDSGVYSFREIKIREFNSLQLVCDFINKELDSYGKRFTCFDNQICLRIEPFMQRIERNWRYGF